MSVDLSNFSISYACRLYIYYSDKDYVQIDKKYIIENIFPSIEIDDTKELNDIEILLTVDPDRSRMKTHSFVCYIENRNILIEQYNSYVLFMKRILLCSFDENGNKINDIIDIFNHIFINFTITIDFNNKNIIFKRY